MPSLLAIVLDRPELSRFVAALEAAGVASLLAGAEFLTVFAPIDADSPDDHAPLPRQAQLRQHMCPGQAMAIDLLDRSPLTTLQGTSLAIGNGAGLCVDGVFIIDADIEASNGVLHVIAGWLAPHVDA